MTWHFHHLKLIGFSIAIATLMGCAAGDREIKDWAEFEPLRGRCYETKLLCFLFMGDRLYPAGNGAPASIEDWNKLSDEGNTPTTQSPKHCYFPLDPGTRFRVQTAYSIWGDTGGIRIDILFLNGPEKGLHANAIDVFSVSDHSATGYKFVVPPYLRPCEPGSTTDSAR